MQKQDQVQKNQIESEILKEQKAQNISQDSPILSQHMFKYQTYYQKMAINQSTLGKIYTTLSSQKIIKQPNFARKMQVSIVQKYKDSLKLQLKWGNFKLEVNLLKVLMNFKLFNGLAYIQSGQFGKIYHYVINNKKYTMKSVQCKNDLQVLYKQYFIAKICSALKIGPALYSLFGYDILLFNDLDGQFIMQKCQKIAIFNGQQKTNINNIESQLSKSIHVMHRLHICHGDIKPQNIMFSPIYQKYVLIDFGLSRIVKQEIGSKTLTSFVGTFQYTSPQMKKLYFLKTSNYIDLYFNDISGLLTSLNNIKRKIDLINIDTNYSSEENEGPIFNLVRLFNAKFFIFTKNYSQALKYILQENYLTKSARKIFLSQILQLPNKQLEQQIKQAKNKLQIQLKESSNILDQQFLCYLTHFYDNTQSQYLNLGYLSELSCLSMIQNKELLFYRPIIVQNLFSTIVDLFQSDSKIQLSSFQTQRKINLIQKIYDFKYKNSQPFISQKVFSQPTLLYKTQIVLKFFMEIFIQQNNLCQIQRIRLIFVELENYQAVQQIEEIFLEKSKDHPFKFFILRCKYFCQKIFWSNNISFYPSDLWLKQVQQKYFKNQQQNVVLINKLKQLSICILSYLLNQESIQKLQNSLEIIKQLKYCNCLPLGQQQELSTISTKIAKAKQILSKFKLLNSKFQSALIKMVKGMHSINRNQSITPFKKFGQAGYINMLSYTNENQQILKAYKQYLSLFRKGTNLYKYQIEYLLEEPTIKNKQLNFLLLNQFIENIQDIQIATVRHATLGLSILNVLFDKFYQNSSTYLVKFHNIHKILWNFRQKIISFCNQNNCLQKMDVSHLIFTKFYTGFVTKGIQQSINDLIMQIQTNHLIITCNPYIFDQVIQKLKLLLKRNSYRNIQINGLLHKYINCSPKNQIIIKNWTFDTFMFKINDSTGFYNKFMQIFCMLEFLVIKLKVLPQSATIISESQIHKYFQKFIELMPVYQIKQILQKFQKSYSLRFIAENHFLSIAVLFFFCNPRMNSKATKILLKPKNKEKLINTQLNEQSIELDLKENQRLLKLCLFGIQRIQSISLKNYYVVQIYKIKSGLNQSKSSRKQLIQLRKCLQINFTDAIQPFNRKMSKKIKIINQKYGKIKTRILSKLKKMKKLGNLHK